MKLTSISRLFRVAIELSLSPNPMKSLEWRNRNWAFGGRIKKRITSVGIVQRGRCWTWSLKKYERYWRDWFEQIWCIMFVSSIVSDEFNRNYIWCHSLFLFHPKDNGYHGGQLRISEAFVWFDLLHTDHILWNKSLNYRKCQLLEILTSLTQFLSKKKVILKNNIRK